MPHYADVMMRVGDQIKKSKSERLEQLRIQKGVGQEMAELLADPKWQMWANHIEASKKNWQDVVNREKERLTKGFLDPKEYGEVRIALASAEAWLEALTHAVSLARDLVERGEVAAHTIEKGGMEYGLDAETKKAH